jgi:hypothetical protein
MALPLTKRKREAVPQHSTRELAKSSRSSFSACSPQEKAISKEMQEIIFVPFFYDFFKIKVLCTCSKNKKTTMTEVLCRRAKTASKGKPSVQEIKRMLVKDLHEKLKALDLDMPGKKAELQNRLITALHPDSGIVHFNLSFIHRELTEINAQASKHVTPHAGLNKAPENGSGKRTRRAIQPQK